ncbi:MAG: P1 family peptidase [Chloroflexi bacterium]|nr:P1 family peptidase [Chloroflexota bacterium]
MSNRPRTRDLGIKIGNLEPGKWNAITDVPGIRVGHSTIIEGEGKLVPGTGPIRTGCTAIWTHSGDMYLEKVTGTVHRINGFGEVTNSEQIHEMGFIEGPIMITNTFNVARVADAVIDWHLTRNDRMGAETWGVSPIVAETSDAYLNDIRGRHVAREHVFHAIDSARDGAVEEGAVGGGTGMTCYEFKGGIGTSSRKIPENLGGYTVGALVQSNFGLRSQLMIDGVPVGKELLDYGGRARRASDPARDKKSKSIIVVIATDAPCSYRQLNRLATRAHNGLARTGSHSGNTSGDFVIAFSTTRRKYANNDKHVVTVEQIVETTDLISYLFWAVVEATEEAVLNSLFKSETMIGRDDRVAHALPIEETVEIMKKYGHHGVHNP